MKIRKFRKKPIEIKAIQYDGTQQSFKEIDEFTLYTFDCRGTDDTFILTQEGEMTVNKWDWIIEDENGVFYPCPPEIFKQTYDEV